MIFNMGSSGNSNMNAEDVSYKDSNVSEALEDLAGTVEYNQLKNNSRFSTTESSIDNLEAELTANGKRIYMDYQNGQYGYNTDSRRGADTFSPFKSDSDGRMIPYLEVGTSDTASAECSVKINCKGCTTLHIDSIIQTNGTNYGSISIENGARVQTELDKPQYNYSVDISEWASTHDLIELYIYTYKCRFNMTNIYCD